MAKTIKQIAEELGVSKQAVFKRIDNLGLRSKLTKIDNQFTVSKEQENLIKKDYFKNKSTTISDNQSSTNLYLVDTLKEQLKVKDRQIEELNKRLEENQRLLDQQQQLHAMAEKKIQSLEHKDENKESLEEVQKGLFRKIFNKKKKTQ